MSVRHRSEVPKPAPSERRVQHHRERQATRQALAATNAEEVLAPRTRHTLHVEHPREVAEVGGPRRFRHWKTRFWKRRNVVRHDRNLALAQLANLEAVELEGLPVLVERQTIGSQE